MEIGAAFDVGRFLLKWLYEVGSRMWNVNTGIKCLMHRGIKLPLDKSEILQSRRLQMRYVCASWGGGHVMLVHVCVSGGYKY